MEEHRVRSHQQSEDDFLDAYLGAYRATMNDVHMPLQVEDDVRQALRKQRESHARNRRARRL